MGLARLWGKLTRVFGRTRRGHANGRQVAAPHLPRGPQTGYLDPRSFVRAVKSMSATEQGRRARLHVFSLGDFHNAVGGKWGRLESLIAIATDSIIRRHINPKTDIFTHLDSETSLLAMPQTPRNEARICVAAIARDLASYLFGDAVIAGRRPQVIAANLPLSRIVTSGGELDAKALRSAVTEAGAALVGEPHAAASVDLHRAALASLLDDADIAVPKETVATGAEDPGWLDFHLRSRAEEALAGRQPLRPDTTLSLAWTPTWTAVRQAVAGFQAHVIRHDGKNAPLLEGSRAYADTAPMGALTIDRFVATQTARELRDLGFERQQMPAILPVYWSSLAPRWRGYLLTAFEGIPVGTRQKYLRIEVIGLPATLTPEETAELLEPLAAMECGVLVRLPLDAFDSLPPLGPPVQAVGIDLGELTEKQRVGDDALFAHLERCRRTAMQAKLNCYVWGLRRRALIIRLARSGFALLNGPGLMADLSRPYVPPVRRAG